MRRLEHEEKISGAWILSVLAFCMLSNAALAETESSIMRGGELYDKWYKVIGVDAPKDSHPLYPKEGKYADKAKANWRCKECHGWDYKGKDGAYSSGKHYSGIKGIQGMKGAAPDQVVKLLKDNKHGYGDKLNTNDLQDLALFVTQGQIDMDKYIDASTKTPKGDKAKGAAYYNTICAKCHGKDGTLPEDMKPFGAQMGNPWEVMHKILNGQPDEKMPALRALDHQIAADIMAHMTTLPKER